MHLPDGLHRLLGGGPAKEGEPRTRKPGHWTSTHCWCADRGEMSFFYAYSVLFVFFFPLLEPLWVAFLNIHNLELLLLSVTLTQKKDPPVKYVSGTSFTESVINFKEEQQKTTKPEKNGTKI